jgi:hypothetical protein
VLWKTSGQYFDTLLCELCGFTKGPKHYECFTTLNSVPVPHSGPESHRVNAAQLNELSEHIVAHLLRSHAL